MKEGNLDAFMNKLFRAIKDGGKWLQFINTKNILFFFTPIYLLGIWLYLNPSFTSNLTTSYLSVFFALLGLMMVMRSFSERKYPRLAWALILFNHLSLALAVSFNENFEFMETLIFLIGIVSSGILGFVCLNIIRKKEPTTTNMFTYNGHVSRYPTLAFVFFIATLGLEGFPITSAFLGEDLLFSHIHQEQYLLGLIVATSFIISGISLIRIYSRIFLGPSEKPKQSNPILTA